MQLNVRSGWSSQVKKKASRTEVVNNRTVGVFLGYDPGDGSWGLTWVSLLIFLGADDFLYSHLIFISILYLL